MEKNNGSGNAMWIRRAELAAVTAKVDQYPPDDRPEIAFAGRSNVGKSSLLNLLTGRKALAKVSGNPGKTRTINFFDVEAGFSDDTEGDFRIVDLPGYGYARVSKKMRDAWGQMMDQYLESRQGLLAVVQLVDIRHAPSDQDVQMQEYLRYQDLDGLVVATKADKVKKSQLSRHLADIRRALGVGESDAIVPVSALKRTGREDLLAAMARILTGENP